MDEYTRALCASFKQWGGNFHRPVDTIYLGGGSPALMSHRLMPLLEELRQHFAVLPDAEITLELNPSSDPRNLLQFAKNAGVNRLSIGAQSGNDEELKLLGRTHLANDTAKTVETARRLGFDNISLDIMLGLPNSAEKSLAQSLDFIAGLCPDHISAYLLKIEQNTAFYREQSALNLPDDDEQAAQYLLMCDFLKAKGYSHYEISNFCKAEKESRHNLKYWKGSDYLGIGPSAHSCVDGRRFYYPRDLRGFIKGIPPLPDGDGGNREEYIMLRLRLSSGISPCEYESKFGSALPKSFLTKCKAFEKAGLMKTTRENIRLSARGMLLSNSIITELLECIE